MPEGKVHFITVGGKVIPLTDGDGGKFSTPGQGGGFVDEESAPEKLTFQSVSEALSREGITRGANTLALAFDDGRVTTSEQLDQIIAHFKERVAEGESVVPAMNEAVDKFGNKEGKKAAEERTMKEAMEKASGARAKLAEHVENNTEVKDLERKKAAVEAAMKASDKGWELIDENREVGKKLKEASEQLRSSARKFVTVEPGKMTTAQQKPAPDLDPLLGLSSFMGMSHFNQLCSREAANGKTVTVKNAQQGAVAGREWQSSYFQPKDASINLAPGAGAAMMVHELGHWLEHIDPEVNRQAQAFLARRTEGEQFQPLSNFSQDYGPDERTRPDKFMDPYMGRDNGPDSTEIVSMGLEKMYANPARFAKEDPDHFSFIYNLMRS